MNMIAKNTDNTIPASVAQIGIYFNAVSINGSIKEDIAMSQNAIKLAKAIMAMVDENEYEDGFVKSSHSVLLSSEMDYLGFEDKAKNLVFFEDNKVEIIEVMNDIVKTDYNSDLNRLLKSLAFHTVDDAELITVYNGMIGDSNNLTAEQDALREKMVLELLKNIIFSTLGFHEGLLEMNDFMTATD